jgi:hypothetical protein
VTAALTIDEIDEGLKTCFKAGKKCDGYLVQAREAKRDRVGNFCLDSLHFDRPVNVTGWSFNALIILVDNVVVYTLYGGQPLLQEHEHSRNPLGPLQGWGEFDIRVRPKGRGLAAPRLRRPSRDSRPGGRRRVILETRNPLLRHTRT